MLYTRSPVSQPSSRSDEQEREREREKRKRMKEARFSKWKSRQLRRRRRRRVWPKSNEFYVSTRRSKKRATERKTGSRYVKITFASEARNHHLIALPLLSRASARARAAIDATISQMITLAAHNAIGSPPLNRPPGKGEKFE